MAIRFDNGTSLGIGNERTPQAKTAKVQNEYVNAVLARYNPEIVAALKEAALAALRKREVVDNMIAAQKGLKPYSILNVELNDGTDDKSAGYMGWYYVTIAVDGKIRAHLESGLAHAIASGTVSETPTREKYFTAGALKEADADYVFNNVGFSSASTLYSLPITADVLKRAKRTLAERGKAWVVSQQDRGTRRGEITVFRSNRTTSPLSRHSSPQNPFPATSPPKNQKIWR